MQDLRRGQRREGVLRKSFTAVPLSDPTNGFLIIAKLRSRGVQVHYYIYYSSVAHGPCMVQIRATNKGVIMAQDGAMVSHNEQEETTCKIRR